MTERDVFSLAPQASFETVGDGAVILLSDSGQLYSCNETSETFLRHLDGRRTVAEIARAMQDEYDVSHEALVADLKQLASDLEAEGIVVSGL